MHCFKVATIVMLGVAGLAGLFVTTSAGGTAQRQLGRHRGDRHLYWRRGRNRCRVPMGKWDSDISGSAIFLPSRWTFRRGCRGDAGNRQWNGAEPA